MKRVLALDPGDRVGWARVDIDDDGSWSNLRHGISELKPTALKVDQALTYQIVPSAWAPGQGPSCDDPPCYDVVICEDWRLYAHQAKHMVGSEIPSAQFIGMVKLACWKSGVPLVMQFAKTVNSNRPGVLSPAESSMKRIRPELFELVMQPGAHDNLHDMVAIKHLWAFTFKNYPVETFHEAA